MQRIYLAGPEVFLPDATLVGEQKKQLCRQYGFEGLFPLDGEIAPQASPRATGLVISQANEALIAQADIVIANLTPFRGPSADVGTVYELGLARGLGKKIHGYSNDARLFTDRVLAEFAQPQNEAKNSHPLTEPRTENPTDRDGLAVEAFDLHDNLMIDGGIVAAGGQFLVHACEPQNRYRDLTAFEALLKTITA